jgi:hypothetical protein
MGYDGARGIRGAPAEKELAMMVRFVLTTIGIVLAVISLKRMFDQLRGMPGRVPVQADAPPPLAVTQLRQDPATGVYYPAD